VCQFVRDLTIRTGHVEAGKILVVPGSVDVQRFDPRRTRPAAVRTQLALPAGVRLIGHAGMHDWKGWREMLAALRSCGRRFPTLISSWWDAARIASASGFSNSPVRWTSPPQ